MPHFFCGEILMSFDILTIGREDAPLAWAEGRDYYAPNQLPLNSWQARVRGQAQNLQSLRELEMPRAEAK